MEKTITGTVVDKAKKESKNGKDYIELKIQDEEGSDYPVVVRAFDDDMVVQCDSQIKKGSRVALNITQNDQGYRDVVGIAEVISGDGTPASTATVRQFTQQNTPPKQVTQDEKPLFPAAPAVDTRQTQIMLQNATGHSTAAYNTWIKLDPKTRGAFRDYLSDICQGATWILENHYVPCGYKGTEPAKSPEQDNYEGTSGVLDVME